MNTADAVYALIAPRIPVGYSTSSAMVECRRIARLYVNELCLPEEIDLDDINEADLVGWLRGCGYEMLDEPFSPYGGNSKPVARGDWGCR